MLRYTSFDMPTFPASENFARWDAALQTGDPKFVASLYAENLTLLPTMAKTVMTDYAGAEQYFAFFGSFRPTVKIMEEHTIPIFSDSYLHCGVYQFMLDRDGERKPLDARFTMMWKKNEAGEWKILHHHSSAIPQV